MSKYALVEVKVTTYIKVLVENDKEELALIEAEQKFNEMNIATANIEIIQTDGTVHMDRVDDWEIEDYEIVDEEE